MPTRVKICGITRLEDAELAVELGAAALGFNFYPHSPRYVVAADAFGIIQRLPPFVVTVGIFADETDVNHISDVAREAGVNAVQLHNSGAPASAGAALGRYPVIWTVAVANGFIPEDLKGLKVTAFLLDAPHPTLRGGTGKTFDWNLALEAKKYGRIILAGGLTPENVGEAIRAVRPYAVDVASGVEYSPGKKDPAKLRAFFAAVEEADRTD
jgi:phosphoribosylanthranilate isomerase